MVLRNLVLISVVFALLIGAMENSDRLKKMLGIDDPIAEQKIDLPEMGFVKGLVTFNGKPLSKAGIGFSLVSGGRQTLVVLDDSGHYATPAIVGLNKIMIFFPDGTHPTVSIPDKYFLDSVLRCEVKSGDNTFNMELCSDGEESQFEGLKNCFLAIWWYIMDLFELQEHSHGLLNGFPE